MSKLGDNLENCVVLNEYFLILSILIIIFFGYFTIIYIGINTIEVI